MAGKEIIVPHEDLEDSQTITQVNEKMFKEHDLDIHMNDVLDITDDYERKVRRYKIKNTKFFDMGRSRK